MKINTRRQRTRQ